MLNNYRNNSYSFFRTYQFIRSHGNVYLLSVIIDENKHKTLEEVHHSIAIATILLNHDTLRAIILGRGLWLSGMDRSNNGTAESLYDAIVWRFLL